jgi:hypothetical protein
MPREVQNCAGDNDRHHDQAIALHKGFFQIRTSEASGAENLIAQN